MGKEGPKSSSPTLIWYFRVKFANQFLPELVLRIVITLFVRMIWGLMGNLLLSPLFLPERNDGLLI